ncbi:baculoviral IAP repeat-containing protein 3-like [Dreissena polymorpha]|uniref:baculoviral IAP repeat-containing protein 3-like n=1 Tax=Dreissena polymorpha TaxID=45954 RepID=UPI0022641DEF|nr:baculoviral IAP repeat-containing protein 3-like [Dreissena polymorpha]
MHYDIRGHTKIQDSNFATMCSAVGEGDLVRCLPAMEDCVTGKCTMIPGQRTAGGIHPQNQLTETSNQQYRYPVQSETEARLETFDNFQIRFPINVDDLAQAGLFYTGVRDYVRCFACGLGLRNWKDDSDPLIEHIKWSTTCIFLTDLIGEYATSNLFQKAVTEESVVTFRNTQTNEDDPRLELNGEAQGPGDAICDVIRCTQTGEKTLLHDSIESMSQINAIIAENIHLKEMITCQAFYYRVNTGFCANDVHQIKRHVQSAKRKLKTCFQLYSCHLKDIF